MKPNPNIAIPIHITPHHLALSPELSEFVFSKVAKLPRFASDALSADVVLRRHHGTAHGKTFSASARLALPGRDLHATATHADLYSAVTGLTRKLARQSRKREARRARASKGRHRSSRRGGHWTRREAPARWSDTSVQDALTPAPETTSPSVAQAPGNTPALANGLVERSSSSNPAHGISFRYLECLAGYSRDRALGGDA